MFTNKIETSTCHICLEELSYKPCKINKKCCPTKAFICNGCWENLNNNPDTIRCPLCNSSFEVDLESGNKFLCINYECNCSCNNDELKCFLKNILTFVYYELFGIGFFILLVYLFHSDNTTFTEEKDYFFSEAWPFFWIFSFLIGIFVHYIILTLYICLSSFIKSLINYEYTQRQKDIIKLFGIYLSFLVFVILLGLLVITLLIYLQSEDINDFKRTFKGNIKLKILAPCISIGSFISYIFVIIRGLCKDYEND